MPSTAASSYRPGFSDSSFSACNAPSGARATTSVNVPPRSIQNSQPVTRLARRRRGAPPRARRRGAAAPRAPLLDARRRIPPTRARSAEN